MQRDSAVLDLTVYTKDSIINRNTIINGVCKCGNEFRKQFRPCYTQGGMFCRQCILVVCNAIKIQTNLDRRGVEHCLQDPKVKEKGKQTNLEKLGVEHVSQDPNIKEQIKQTNLEKRGVEHPMQDPKVKEKGKQTNLEKRGVEHVSQDPKVKEKMKETNLAN